MGVASMSVLGMNWTGRPRELPVTEPSTKQDARVKRRLELPTGRLILLVVIALIIVEALLGARLWAQLTNQEIDSGDLPMIFRVTDRLISPFAAYESTSPIRETGIVDISTLVAMQAYFFIAAAIIIGIAALGGLISVWFRPLRDVVVIEEEELESESEVAAQLNEALP
jgi:hypothetical protein